MDAQDIRTFNSRIGAWRRLPRAIVLVAALAVVTSACSSDQEREANLDLEQQRRLAGPQVGKWLYDAQQALHMGSYSLALSLTDSVEKHAPRLADAPFLRGRILTDMNQVDEAEASYRRVTQLDAHYRGVWLNLGNIAYRSGRPRTALERYEREYLHHPSPQVANLIGNAYDELNLPDSAQAAYEKAIELDSSFALAYARLAQLHSRNGAFDQSLHRARQALRLEPDNPQFRFFVGHAFLQNGDAERAATMLQPVADQHRWFRAAHYDLAKALEFLGREEEASRYAARADSLRKLDAKIDAAAREASLSPLSADRWGSLGEYLSLAGRSSEALDAYYKAVHLAPEQVEWQHEAANLELESGRVSQAIARYRIILEREPALSDVWVDLGMAYQQIGQSDLAGQAWKQALKQDPNHQRASALLNAGLRGDNAVDSRHTP